MDPLTHYCAGYLIGHYHNAEDAGIRAVTLCAMLPDIDAIVVLSGWHALCGLHRTATHSLLGAFIIAFSVTAVFALWKGRAQALQILPWCVAGVMSHLFLDMFAFKTSLLTILGVAAAQASRPEYLEGIQLFWPLSEVRFSVVNLGILTQESTNLAMIAVFCVLAGSVLSSTIKGSRPWGIWTDPIFDCFKRQTQ